MKNINSIVTVLPYLASINFFTNDIYESFYPWLLINLWFKIILKEFKIIDLK